MVFIGSCLFMALSTSVAQPNDHELSVTRLYNSEPFIAQDPTHPMSLAVAWMTYDLRARVVSIAVRSSSDGGATWSDTTALPHFGAGWGSADVSMVWSTSGTLFLSYVDYLNAGTTTEGGVYVARSDNGGRTWHTPVRAIDAHANTDLPIDRPWLEIDRSSGPSANTLYLCTKPAPWDPLPNHSYLTISRDSGHSWLPIKALDVAPYSAGLIKAPMGSDRRATAL